MSKGPTGTGNKYVVTRRLNLKISKKDWCKYLDKCLIEENLDQSLCIYCKWRIELDVRLLLDIKAHEKEKK
jgi:hypothetical protein